MTSSPAITPYTPSNLPPVSWVSRWLPVRTTGRVSSRPDRRANRFPTESTRTVQPAACAQLASSARPSQSASVNACRLQPPWAVAPIFAIAISRDHSRSPLTRGEFPFRTPRGLHSSDGTRRGGRLAPQRLRHAMNAAAGLGYLAHVDFRHLESTRAQRSDQDPARFRSDDPDAPQGHEVASQIHRIRKWHIDDLVPLRPQPIDQRMLGAIQANRGELLGHRHHHEIDVHVILVEEREPRLPTLPLEPTLDLARGLFWGPAAAAADQDAIVFDDVEVAALEGTGRHHVVDRNTQVLVVADGGVVLAPPPPIGHRRDDGAERGHDARVAGIHLHRQFGLETRRVDAHAEVLVGRGQLPVLRLRHANIRRAFAQILARQRAGGDVAQVIRGGQQHIGQGIGFIAETPVLQAFGPTLEIAPLQREGVSRIGLRTSGYGFEFVEHGILIERYSPLNAVYAQRYPPAFTTAPVHFPECPYRGAVGDGDELRQRRTACAQYQTPYFLNQRTPLIRNVTPKPFSRRLLRS